MKNTTAMDAEKDTKKYWLYSPGESAKYWKEFHHSDVMGIGWDDLGNLKKYESKELIRESLISHYGNDTSRSNDALANYQFANEIRPGDIIIVKKGRNTLLGYGEVTSLYYFDDNTQHYKSRISVSWKLRGEWQTNFPLNLKTLTDITIYESKHVGGKFYDRLLAIMKHAPKNSWLFQGNPQKFNIVGYLNHIEEGNHLLWSMSRYYNEVKIGDIVYLWRSGSEAGIVAKAIVIESPMEQNIDTASFDFIIDESQKSVAPRVKLKLLKLVSSDKTFIKKNWLINDPICHDMHLLRNPMGTNFRLNNEQSERISDLINNTGINWTEEDVTSALFTYSRIRDTAFSKDLESEIAKTAIQIGRAVSGVYNKMLNLRHLDPQQEGGLSHGSKIDKIVWDKYYDKKLGQIDLGKFDQRYKNSASQSLLQTRLEEHSKKVDELGYSTLEELKEKIDGSSLKPRKIYARSSSYSRSPAVAAYAKIRSNHSCELPLCEYQPFITGTGMGFVEIHHIHRLADGGPDVIENVIALCPNHHREVHYSSTSESLTKDMKEVRENDAKRNSISSPNNNPASN